MNEEDIRHLRLQNQGLSPPSYIKVPDVVKSLGAVQAQDYAMSKWSVGQRLKQGCDEDIEKAYNDGLIIRTHVMRPTWHFVRPDDIRWMLQLTAPRVKTILAHYDRKLELTDSLLSRCYGIIEKSLQGKKYLTRAQLGESLKKKRIPAHGQLLGHIMGHAELEGLICSGPRNGKQFTYALLEERVKPVKKISRDESLAKLAFTYFQSHGPAQLKDFVWWSGLLVKDAQKAVDLAGSQLEHQSIEDTIYFFSKDMKKNYKKSKDAYLLSIYDEYVIAYRDRSALGGENYAQKLLTMGNALTAVLILDGKIAGTWKRIVKKDSLELIVSPLRQLTRIEYEAINTAMLKYGKFMSMPIYLKNK